MAQKSIKPTESELQILQVLWTHGPSTVRFVNDQMNKEKETGYTTTLKLMQIMSDKGIVSRDTTSRTHVYEACITEEDTQKSLLSNFLNATFKGSAKSLVMQTLGNHKASREELEEIKKFIKQLENE